MSRRLPLIALIIPLAGCALDLGSPRDFGSSPELSTTSLAIVNGATSRGDDAVVALTVGGAQFCTGTLFASRFVLTAAHCLPPHIEVDVKAMQIVVGPSLDEPLATIPAIAGTGHPEWTIDGVPNDIGILALAADAPIPPAALPLLPFDRDFVGASARMVGYGFTATDRGDNGTKRQGMMEIESFDDHTIYLKPGPAATCNGDSGGPLFLAEGGHEVISGVHSRSDCEVQSLNERVDVHVGDFIEPFIEAVQGPATCGQDSLCAQGCASPDPDCPCAADGICSADCPRIEGDPDCYTCGDDDGMCPGECSMKQDSNCPGGACAADGVCEGSCDADPDCEPGTGGCTAAGGDTAPSPAWLLIALVIGALRRRRRVPAGA